MLEDYYGFTGRSAPGPQASRHPRTSQRTQRPPRSVSSTAKSPSPTSRSLRRTQLSKQKLQARTAQDNRRLQPPQLTAQGTALSSEARGGLKVAERQQIEQMAQKYDSYKLADSYEFASGAEGKPVSRPMPPRPPSSNKQEWRSRAYRQGNDSRRRGSEYSKEERYYYRSESRGRSVVGSSFQRGDSRRDTATRGEETPRQQRASPSSPRVRKSKSLGMRDNGFQMHTFYHMDLKRFNHYNGEGYTTTRQAMLLNRVEEKALKAFYKAAVEAQQEAEKSKQKAKPPQQQRRFHIEQSSTIRHQNSRILSNLTSEDHEPAERHSPQPSQKIKNNEKVVDMSISPKKESPKKDSSYDDYLMGAGSRVKSSSEQGGGKTSQHKSVNIFKRFEEDDDSLLEFKPIKAEPTPRKPSIHSVDMMGINSNYKAGGIGGGIGGLGLDSMAPGELGMDTNKPGHPLVSIANNSGEPDLPVNTIRPNRVPKQSNVEIDLPQSGSPKQSENQEKSKKASQELARSLQSNSSYQSSSHPPSRTPLSSSKSQSFRDSDAIRESSDLSSHNFVKSSQHSQPYSIKKSEIPEVKEESIEAVVSTPPQSKLPVPATKHKIKRLSKKSSVREVSDVEPEVVETLKVKVSPMKGSKVSERPSKSDMGISEILAKQEGRSVQEIKSPSHVSRRSRTSQISRASFGSQSQTPAQSKAASMGEYDLFEELREFFVNEQELAQPRRQKFENEMMSETLVDVLRKVEEHIQIVSFFAEIILLVPEVYDFETIYSEESQWLWLQVWLTLKRYLHERKRVVGALEGGQNCFVLLGKIVDDPFLRAHSAGWQMRQLCSDLKLCNRDLEELVYRCQAFLLNFSPDLVANPIFATTNIMGQETGLLLESYYQEIERLLGKRAEEWGEREVEESESCYDTAMLLNERVFRLMEIGFALSNLCGREIKPYESEEDLHEDHTEFNNYLFHNKEQFRQMIRYFK